MKVKCINNLNRPATFPLSKWLVLDKVYTILEVVKMNQQGGLLGCKLEEIDTDGLFPHTHFRLDRFAPTDEVGDDELQEALDEILEEELIN